MNRVVLKVDQAISIGQDIRISPTDIDLRGVRLLTRGRVLGGPNDGENIDAVHEMTIGASVHIGPQVVVTLVAVRGDAARFDIFTPVNVSVQSDG